MKVLRFLLVVIFLSTLLVIPAQAQGVEYRFLPLVTQANPSLPLEMQARQAFNRLLPELLVAQKNGAIWNFEPDLSAGILKIEYSAGNRASVSAQLQGMGSIHEAVAMVPHDNIAGAVGFLTISPTFLIAVYSSCFSAGGLGTSSQVIGSLRDKTGRVIANYAGSANASGNLYDCWNSTGPFDDQLPGYKMTFSVYDPLHTLLGTFVATAPAITFATVNKATSVVTGSGPMHKAYTLSWWHPRLDAMNTTLNVTKTGTIPTNGKWSVDFGTTKIRGADEVKISVTQNAAFTFYQYISAPYIYCTPGGNYCSFNGLPEQAVALTIVHGGITHTFTGKSSFAGSFNVYLENTNGTPIFLVAGDKISGTGIPVYSLPNLTAAPNYVTDVVSGKSPANKYVNSWVWDVINNGSYEFWAHANSSGNYSADFSSQFDLQAGNPLSFEAYYMDPVTGNITDKYFAVGP